MVPSILVRRGLGYPGGILRPGFDPSHPAAAGMSIGNGFSAIAVPGNMINLLNAVAGAIVTTVGALTWGTAFGLPGNLATAGGIYSKFTGNNAANAPSVTFAGIFIPTDITHFNTVLSNTILTSGTQLILSANSNNTAILNNWNGTNFGAAPTFAANVPQFIAMSGNANASFGLVLNLLNGKVNTSTGAGATPLGSLDGVYTCGNAAIGGSTSNLYWIAGMYKPVFTPPAVIQEWARDPWSFWFPTPANIAGFDAELVRQLSGGGVAPGVINLPTLGVGG